MLSICFDTVVSLEFPYAPGASYPICELIPNLAWSSGAKRPGSMPADKSFWIPACFPLRKAAILNTNLEWYCWKPSSRVGIRGCVWRQWSKLSKHFQPESRVFSFQDADRCQRSFSFNSRMNLHFKFHHCYPYNYFILLAIELVDLCGFIPLPSSAGFFPIPPKSL